MSGDGLLSLRWNNHRSSFLHILSVLRTKDSYSDVTLACDGHFYAVHKFVLSTCSDYFVEMIEKTPCKHPVIVLKDIQKGDLEALLNYMYLGEVNVLQNDLARLIKAAECLRIKGLAVPDEAPSPAPPPTPGGGEGGGGGGYSDYPDSRSNKPRRRRYESENSETNSSPVRKRPATGDTNRETHREKASPEQRHSRESSGVLPRDRDREPRDREPTDSHTGETHTVRELEEVNVDLSNVKMEAEELKHEDEPNYVEIEDSSDTDTNMGTVAEGSSSTTQPQPQPPRSSSADTSRIKVEQSSPRSSSQGFQPQSIEEIVSQALPGASIVTGDGSGGPWDGGGSEGDSYQSFPFSQQQDSGGGMHRGSNMGSQHPGGKIQWNYASYASQCSGNSVYGGKTSEESSCSNSILDPNSLYRDRKTTMVQPAINLMHTSMADKIFCHICGYEAVSNSKLNIHIRKHTGEKPFSCTFCDYVSASSSNIKRHMKRHQANYDNTSFVTGS